MFGKFFASAFTGSLFGAGPHVFSVWAYAIAHTRDGEVELNPAVLAAAIGMPVEEVHRAVDYLTSADPRSRSPEEDGRRLVHEGAYLYRVVNAANYRAIRCEDDRRAYNREKQRESRARRKGRVDASTRESLTVSDSMRESSVSKKRSRTEAESGSKLVEVGDEQEDRQTANSIPGNTLETPSNVSIHESNMSAHTEKDLESKSKTESKSKSKEIVRSRVSGLPAPEPETGSNGTSLVPAGRDRRLPAILDRARSVFASLYSEAAQRTGAQDRRRAGAEVVFAYWAAKTGRNGRTTLTSQREAVLIQRLTEGHDDLGELFYAVDGALRDPWYNGSDPRTEGRNYLDFENLFRNRGRVEKLAGVCPGYVAGRPHPMIREVLEAGHREEV